MPRQVYFVCIKNLGDHEMKPAMSSSDEGELLAGRIKGDRSDSARSQGPFAPIRNLSPFSIGIVALFIALGIGTQVWQPFALGFVHDDWSLFVRPHFLRDYTNYHADRPGYFLLSQVILRIWDGTTAEFHWIK